MSVRIDAKTNTEITAEASITTGDHFFSNEGDFVLWVSKDAAMTGPNQGHSVVPGAAWEFDAADEIYVWCNRVGLIEITEI